MKTYFPYNPSEPQEVIGEIHTIKDGLIVLDHIPYLNSIEIVGFVATDSVTLLPHQFRCNYSEDTYYRESNCCVEFNQIHNGERVVVNYLQVGTIILAEDLNEVKSHIEDRSIHFSTLPTASTFQKGCVRIGQGLEMVGDILNCTLVDTIKTLSERITNLEARL